jgi:hypothetical protein
LVYGLDLSPFLSPDKLTKTKMDSNLQGSLS